MVNNATCAYCLFMLVHITGHMQFSIYIQSCASWIHYIPNNKKFNNSVVLYNNHIVQSMCKLSSQLYMYNKYHILLGVSLF